MCLQVTGSCIHLQHDYLKKAAFKTIYISSLRGDMTRLSLMDLDTMERCRFFKL